MLQAASNNISNGMHSDVYETIWFRVGMIEITEVYIFIVI